MQADAEIVRAVLRGERQAFTALMARHERAVWATAWRILRDDHAAADAGQEAFLQAFRRLGALRQPEQFGTWLLRIARREAVRLARRRPVNPELVALDVAFQPGSNGSEGGKYVRIVLGSATRAGVEFSWWPVLPRRPFQIKDGRRVDLPENDDAAFPGEPARLDDLPGMARVPLSATYWDETHRDASGVQQGVSTWAEVPLPPDRPPATIDDVAARARRDVLVMGSGGLLGVAAEAPRDVQPLRPLSHFAPEAVSDAAFAAAVRRGLDDLRRLDEVLGVRREEMPPP